METSQKYLLENCVISKYLRERVKTKEHSRLCMHMYLCICVCITIFVCMVVSICICKNSLNVEKDMN